MFGKKDDFVGKEAFGEGERKPRELKRPGTFYEYNDVRINRLGLSLLRTFKDSVPDVFRREIMDVIGASNTWRWIPYHNSFVDVDGKRIASVSGGTRWGGGVWINAQDMARFGYLWLRGGKWGDRQLLPPDYVKAAVTPERPRPRLRLPVVAEHPGQELSRAARQRLRRPRRRQQHHHHPARSGPGGGLALARRQRGRVREAGRRRHQGAEHGPLTWDCADWGSRRDREGRAASEATGPEPRRLDRRAYVQTTLVLGALTKGRADWVEGIAGRSLGVV